MSVAETALPERCPICLKGNPRFSFRKWDYDLYQCPDCRFLFVHPFPEDEEILGFYNRSYRRASADHYPKAASRARRAFVKSLGFLRLARGRAVLDIGCGGGFMAAAFARLGAVASGLDINAGAIDYARRHFPRCRFYCETLAAFRARGLRYDLVFCSEVIEHLSGPDELMATIEAITGPGSHLYLATPDSGHARVPRDLSQWSDVQPPEHLQFFDRSNLAMLLARHGFRLAASRAKRKPSLSMLFVRG